ncbi:tRNA-dihydrouridine synthase [Candidatus Pantoea edessiphila]|uniref:tRNA-dihydrouridine synthase n=1 Tax=Candidatus Pantoea edessiphila TaxID=2044610 RepID=UPI0030D5350F
MLNKQNNYGYNEINLNIGCSSYKAQHGYFGASLITNANLVADNIKAINDIVSIPVTVKIRIGINEQDNYDFFKEFYRYYIRI